MTARELNRRYFRELGGALAVYTALVFTSVAILGHEQAQGIKVLVALLPMVGVGLALVAIGRHLRDADEYVRHRSLVGLAIAAGVTAGWTLTWGFLENAGFPRLSMFAVWPVMGLTWGLSSLFCRGGAQ